VRHNTVARSDESRILTSTAGTKWALRVGVNILNFGPGVSPEALLEWAQRSEALGYHSVMISDHVAITPTVRERYPEPYYDPFAALAWLAGHTKRVQLGTTVAVLPYRHPVLTARLAANIDQLSGGRFILGVGVGNAEDEFTVLGQPRSKRGVLANDCLQAVLALWTGDGPVTFHGRLVAFEDVWSIETRQQPHPPVWVGGHSEAAFRRAARYGDAWHPILRSLDSVRQSGLAGLRRAAEQEDRPVPAFCPRIKLDLRDQPIAGERVPGCGSLDQVRADLLALWELGAQHVILDWFTGDLAATQDHKRGLGMLRLLAEQVLDLTNEAVR
jgi:probable F420-dependent oxidoreductase